MYIEEERVKKLTDKELCRELASVVVDYCGPDSYGRDLTMELIGRFLSERG